MRKYVALTIVTGLMSVATASATQTSTSDLVAACQNEAKAAYSLAWRMEPTLRPSIDAHRKRQSAACAAFATGKTNTTAALSQCLRESSAGPVHVQRARHMDHAHMARQRELCRALGGDVKPSANPPAQ